LQENLESTRTEVSQLLEDRDKAMSNSEKLVLEVQHLQQSLSQLTHELQSRLEQYKNEKTNAEKWKRDYGSLEQKMTGYQETNRDLKVLLLLS
jgi:regulator of replication initiation timing